MTPLRPFIGPATDTASRGSTLQLRRSLVTAAPRLLAPIALLCGLALSACGEETGNDGAAVTQMPSSTTSMTASTATSGLGAPTGGALTTPQASQPVTPPPQAPGAPEANPTPPQTPAQPPAMMQPPQAPPEAEPPVTPEPPEPMPPTAPEVPSEASGVEGSGGAGGAAPMEPEPEEMMGAGGGAAGAESMPGAAGAGGEEPEMMGGLDPCPDAEPCRILPLGDSITEGIGASDNSAYRGALFRLALENGKDITFVGSRTAGPMMIDGTPFPRSHEGTSGITVSGLDMKLGGLVDQIGDAHIILVHIGTNDMYTQPGPAMAPQRLGTFLDNVMSYWPDAFIVVAQITPYPSQNGDIMTYNDAIVPVVQERIDAGAAMMMVDQFSTFPDGALADVVHPNDEGYAHMADVWWAAIEPFLKP